MRGKTEYLQVDFAILRLVGKMYNTISGVAVGLRRLAFSLFLAAQSVNLLYLETVTEELHRRCEEASMCKRRAENDLRSDVLSCSIC